MGSFLLGKAVNLTTSLASKLKSVNSGNLELSTSKNPKDL